MAIFSPHDRLFHATFRNPRHVASWLRHVLPPAILAALDIDGLTLASGRAMALGLRAHVADLVFTSRLLGSDDEVLILLEHKAYHDPNLHNQVLRYTVHLRRLARRRGQCEPLVVPVVLYHGEGTFRLADPGRHDAAFGRLQPHMEFVVDDLSGCSETELRRQGLTPTAQLTLLALARLRHLQNPEVLTAIDRWGDLLRAIEQDEDDAGAQDAIDAFGWYLLEVTDLPSEELYAALSRNVSQTINPIMSTAQRLRLEGHSQGLQQGLSQGLTQGLSQGQTLGQAHTLLRLLQKRFGPLSAELAERVTKASKAELDAWTDRVIDARTLDEVFAA